MRCHSQCFVNDLDILESSPARAYATVKSVRVVPSCSFSLAADCCCCSKASSRIFPCRAQSLVTSSVANIEVHRGALIRSSSLLSVRSLGRSDSQRELVHSYESRVFSELT